MISLNQVSKQFTTKEGTFQAVAPLSLHIAEGDIYGIVGFSGAGKSTLLRLINLLERPTTGTVEVAGQDLTKLAKKELRKARQSIGMVFQQFHLLHNKTVFDNIALPLQLARVERKEIERRVEECLQMVGLEEKRQHYPAQLSGGQKQRVGIARALAHQPKVLLCDEPTSALDPKTTKQFLQFLRDLHRQLGLTIVIVTHEMHVVQQICNKAAVMEEGKIIEHFSLENKRQHAKTDIGKMLFASPYLEEERLVSHV